MRIEAIQNLSGGEKEKISWMLNNMKHNKTYKYLIKNNSKVSDLENLNLLKKRYFEYRQNWRNQPSEAIKLKKFDKNFKPLCIDLEVAAVCDLACPFCYRQYIATPDKIMSLKLARQLIDQASELNVPSMKFNWRGEPLLNPKLPEIIDYAKEKGIIETIINTNATKLDKTYSEKLIKSGLDLLIYSFDGGTKESYEKMRPGRFKKNNFNEILENIKNFKLMKEKLGSKFPRTKIQMVLTSDTRNEQDKFFKLFKDIVDEVSVKQYSERGGKISDVKDEIKRSLSDDYRYFLEKYGEKADMMTNSQGEVFISEGRLPCEQPFQRMLITYDGRTSMCCYDWGTEHPIGYTDQLAIKTGFKEYESVKKKSDEKAKGFEMMKLALPRKMNQPKEKIMTLSEIWYGEEINDIRNKHLCNKISSVGICKNCVFKETYKWKKISK